MNRKPSIEELLAAAAPDDLPEALQEVAEIIGLGPALKLNLVFEGTAVYFSRAALLRARDRIIVRQASEGLGADELARRWRLTNRHVRAILQRAREGEQHEPAEAMGGEFAAP